MPTVNLVKSQGQKCPCCEAALEFETHEDYQVEFCCGRTYSELTVYVPHKAPKFAPSYYGCRSYHLASAGRDIIDANYEGDWRYKYQWE